MFVKLYEDFNMADEDSRKPYRLIECDEAVFFRNDEGKAMVSIYRDDLCVRTMALHGNAYIMNDNGRSIASASPNKIRGAGQLRTK